MYIRALNCFAEMRVQIYFYSLIWSSRCICVPFATADINPILPLLKLECVHACLLSHFSCVQLFATVWTIACQAPLSMGFSRQEYGGALFQGIFLTQGLNPHLVWFPHCRWILFCCFSCGAEVTSVTYRRILFSSPPLFAVFSHVCPSSRPPQFDCKLRGVKICVLF